MGKRIILFSKLPDEEKIYVQSRIKSKDLAPINIFSGGEEKSAVLTTINNDDYLIILDTYADSENVDDEMDDENIDEDELDDIKIEVLEDEDNDDNSDYNN